MPVTFTEKLQLAFESRPRPLSEIKFVPDVAVTLPAVTPVPSVKQVPVRPLGVATVSPDGSVSEKPIFVRFVQEPHGNPSARCSQSGISVSLVRNAIHDYVDLLSFMIEIRLGPKQEVLTAIQTGWKIELRIDRECWVTSC